MSFIRCRLARTLCVAVLVPALLLATAAGARHRIAHAAPALTADAAWDGARPHHPMAHSCAAFDAHTLAERLASAFVPPQYSRQRPPAGACPAFISALLPFVAHYSPRAPPSLRPSFPPAAPCARRHRRHE